LTHPAYLYIDLFLKLWYNYLYCHVKPINLLGEVRVMKKNIHPEYNLINVECSCGSRFETRTTFKKGDTLKTAICSNCHPFYTGKSKFVDETGRVEKFRQKYAAAKK